MKNKVIFGLLAMLFYAHFAFAQLNKSDTTRFQFRAGTFGTSQKGNVTFLTLGSRIEFVSNGNKRFVFKSQNRSLYQEFGGKKTDNDLFSKNFLYYKPQATMYPFSMAFIQTNFRRKIVYRWFAGMGVTYQIVEKPKNILKVSASIVNEDTRFFTDFFNNDDYNGSKNIPVWRGTLYFFGINKFFENKMKIFYTGNWQPALSKRPNNRFQLDFGAEISVWKGLNFIIEYIYNYEQVVARQIKEVDSILTFGFNYQIRK